MSVDVIPTFVKCNDGQWISLRHVVAVQAVGSSVVVGFSVPCVKLTIDTPSEALAIAVADDLGSQIQHATARRLCDD